MVGVQVSVPEMIKYPKARKPRELIDFLKGHPEYRTLEAYVEPKYDGSNITIWRGIVLTRNHYLLGGAKELAEGFLLGLDKEKRDKLLKLSYEYQIFFELGGRANAPAGYVAGWGEKNWDAVLFDVVVPVGVFLEPRKWVGMMNDLGVEWEVMTLGEIADNWVEILKDYDNMEGFVAKVYEPPDEMKKHFRTSLNMIPFKFKHEYLEKSKNQKKRRKKEKLPSLDYTEVLAEVERAHHEVLGEGICDKRKALPIIAKLVQEEAKARNMSVPRGNVIFKAWQEYTRGVCHE